MPTNPEPLALTIKDAAKLIGCSRSTVYELIGDGKLEAFKLGAATRITMASVKGLIATAPRARIVNPA
jgi:excisionase family DNA binding protein